MCTDKDKIVKLHEDIPTVVDVEAHPDEIADVDAETLAIMKARLEGVDFEELYDNNEVLAQSLEVKLQRKKLASVFACFADLEGGFLKDKMKPELQRELRYEGFEPSFIWPEITTIDEITFEDIAEHLNFRKGRL